MGNDSNNNNSSFISTVEIHLPTADFPELPPCRQTTKDLPRHLILTLCKAFRMASPRFSDILEQIKPDLLIYDIFQPWAAETATSGNIPAVCYTIGGAASMAFAHHLLRHRTMTGFPFPAINMMPHEVKNLKKNYENADLNDRIAILKAMEVSTQMLLVNTSMEIEGKYIDHLSAVLGKTTVPIGSLISVGKAAVEDKEKDVEIMRWLDGKEKNSTLYLSFGSEYYLTMEEIQEIAKGLELCKANFIWVIRFSAGDQTPLQKALPKGFLERVKGRGIILEKWAPQTKILSHLSAAKGALLIQQLIINNK